MLPESDDNCESSPEPFARPLTAVPFDQSGCGDFPISEAADEVIVHHADGLHVRVNDGRTDEAESAVLEILAERVGFGEVAGISFVTFQRFSRGRPSTNRQQ